MSSNHEGCGHDHTPAPVVVKEAAPEVIPMPSPSLLTAATASVLSHVEQANSQESLESLYLKGEAMYHHIVDGAATAECVTHDLDSHTASALASFIEASQLIRIEGIFSSNETVDDIKTEDLQFLLVEFYIAQLRMRAAPSDRLRELTSAKLGLELFLRHIVRMKAIPTAEITACGIDVVLPALKRTTQLDDEEEEEEMSLVESKSTYGKASKRTGQDPAAIRMQKIERFKRNTQTKKKLQELALMHARRLELVKRDNNADAIEAASLDGIGASLGGPVIDDESRREMLLLTITAAARQAVDDIISINQELPLLEYMLKAGPRAPGPTDGASTDSRMRQPPSDDPSINPARKGLEVMHIDPTFEVTREVIKADVFTTTYVPPSMTMEEWGEIVNEKRIAREAMEAENRKDHVKTMKEIAGTADEDDEAVHDVAQFRARKHDDWADGVPKGSGSTKRV